MPRRVTRGREVEAAPCGISMFSPGQDEAPRQVRGHVRDQVGRGGRAALIGDDPQFFAFYRAMTAYETSLKNNDTRFVLKPDSEFFRFFNSVNGTAAGPAAPAASR